MLWITLGAISVAVYFAVQYWRQLGEVLLLRYAIRQSTFLLDAVIDPKSPVYRGTGDQLEALLLLREAGEWRLMMTVYQFLEQFDYAYPDDRERAYEVIEQADEIRDAYRARNGFPEIHRQKRPRRVS